MSSSIKRGFLPPFAHWASHQRAWSFVTLLLLTLLVGLGLGEYNTPLQTGAAPQGIVSFELARTTDAAEAILDSWADVMDDAWGNITLDFPWMPMYAGTLALGCVMAGAAWGRRRPGIESLFALLAWGQFLAAFFDVIETGSLAWILHTGSGAQPWPFIAWAAAIAKFILVFAGIAATLSGLVPWALNRRQGPSGIPRRSAMK